MATDLLRDIMREADGGAEGVANDTDGAAGRVRGRDRAEARVNSAALTSFTDAAFFQHCVGDWNQ
eukprot:3309481-Pyramimonas_sp.AAC.1